MSDKARGLSGSKHVAHTQKLMDESTERYQHSCLSATLSIKKATKKQDIGHVDFVVEGETVDLKGLKNSTREGKILLEFLNVAGKTGWCNENGTPLWIAFDFGAFLSRGSSECRTSANSSINALCASFTLSTWCW